jgi:hypothetical protein
MAYRRPAIEVIQEFQEAAAALSLPSLPACVVGPGFQVEEQVDSGVYSEVNLAVTSYPYVNLTTGAIVDLDASPETEAEANAHKSVSVTLRDVFLVKEPALPSTSRITGNLIGPNVFQDLETGAFSSFDPDAAGAPTFYVDIIGGAGVTEADKGRKLVIDKTDDNNLVVAAEWTSGVPITNAEYRILEFREEEVYAEDQLSDNGITATDLSVDINPGLKSVSDATIMSVVEADILLSWRALRPDLAGALTVFTDLDSLEAVFGIGTIVPSNIGAYAVNLALINTTTEINFSGLSASFFTNEEQSFQDALEYLETKDVYGLAVTTHLTAVHQLLKSHVEGQSLSSVGKERVGFVNRKLVELEVLVPASGIGNNTSAGAGNGTSAPTNTIFKDPTNGSFITDDVGVGHFLEIASYTALPGTQRAVVPDEVDYLGAGPDRIQLLNGEFVVTDNGRTILIRGATDPLNDIAHVISGVPLSPVQVPITIPVATAEVLPSTARAWIADLSQTIANDNPNDSVDVATKTWVFANGAFTSNDIGRLLYMVGTGAGNDGVFTIGSILGPTSFTTIEVPGGNETFLGGVTQFIYDVNREPARDSVSDSVDGTSREWTILGGLFTEEDVGRKLSVAGALAGGNNSADHVIEAVISPTIVRTDNTTTPATEVFDGLATVITTLDVVSVTPSTDEAAYIADTRHEIASINSESQVTLGVDPTAGFGGTLEDVVYRVTKDLSLTEQAETIGGYSASLGSRRIVATWPDVLAVSVNGLATKVPGYFAGAVLTGLTAGLPSQAGFTNLTVTGFVGREHSDDLFSDSQLDTIAGGGTMIFLQPVVDSALSIRHQLTTDVSTIFFQEFSVTKNVDLIARFFRAMYAPFLGIYNITDGLLDVLKTKGEGGIGFLLDQRAPRVGAPLRSGQLERIEESATQPDTVEIDIGISVPLPLNNIKLTLLV